MPKDLHFGVCKSSFGLEHSTVVLYDVNLLRYFMSICLCSRLRFTSKVFVTSKSMSHGNLPCSSCLTLSCFARDKCDCHNSSHKCGTVLCASVVLMSVWIRKWKINITPHFYSSISLPSGRKRWHNLIRLLPEVFDLTVLQCLASNVVHHSNHITSLVPN
jgi:hypothetical protein